MCHTLYYEELPLKYKKSNVCLSTSCFMFVFIANGYSSTSINSTMTLLLAYLYFKYLSHSYFKIERKSNSILCFIGHHSRSLEALFSYLYVGT